MMAYGAISTILRRLLTRNMEFTTGVTCHTCGSESTRDHRRNTNSSTLKWQVRHSHVRVLDLIEKSRSRDITSALYTPLMHFLWSHMHGIVQIKACSIMESHFLENKQRMATGMGIFRLLILFHNQVSGVPASSHKSQLRG